MKAKWYKGMPTAEAVKAHETFHSKDRFQTGSLNLSDGTVVEAHDNWPDVRFVLLFIRKLDYSPADDGLPIKHRTAKVAQNTLDK